MTAMATGNRACMRICFAVSCTLTGCVTQTFSPPEPPQDTALHRAFVTDDAYPPDFGGLVGADAICQSEANAAALGGTWLAWLADDTDDPVTRFEKTGAYVRLDGVIIAGDFAELVSGDIWNPIALGPSRKDLPVGVCWTNVSFGGHSSGSGNCANWTSRDISLQGGVGAYNLTDGGWTIEGSDTCDSDANTRNHLYCFEQ